MTTPRPALRVIAVALLLLALLAPAALAVELPYHEELVFDDTASEAYTVPVDGEATNYDGVFGFRVADVTKFKNPKIIYIGDAPVTMVVNPDLQSSGSADVNIQYIDYYFNRINAGKGRLYYNTHFSGGEPSRVQIWLEITQWNTNVVNTGSATYVISPNIDNLGIGLRLPGNLAPGNATDKQISVLLTRKEMPGRSERVFPGSCIVEYGQYWESAYTVSQANNETYNVFVDRKNYYSNVSISDNSATYYDSYGAINVSKDVFKYTLNRPLNLQIIDPYGNVYLRNLLDDPTPDPTPTANSTVTVYVKRSDTGALLADAAVVIQDTTTDPWTEVANTTLPSGTGSVSLAKDPGLHLTQYRIGATVPGYQQVVPALFFRVTGPTYVVVEMEPTSGGPVVENNTYLKFYVRDNAGNGVSSANVMVGDLMRYTNAQGYVQFEVAKNNSYVYTVSKFRYSSVTGTANVGSDESYIVNVVLNPGAVPTYTPVPTDPGTGLVIPDTRSNEDKAKGAMDIIFGNIELYAMLVSLALFMMFTGWITGGRR